MPRRGLTPWLRAGLLLALAGAAVLGLRWWSDPVYRIDGWQGPLAPTPLARAVAMATDPAAFTAGSRHRLAIYLTDTDASWLGLAFGLRSIGVPFVVTTDAQEAVRHAVVLAYPTISGRRVSAQASEALRAHVKAGGTLVGFEILGAGLNDVFGLQAASAAATRRHLRWEDAAARQWGFNEPEERTVPLASAASPLSTYALAPAGAEVLARFDDGQPALLRHAAGRGRAYALGFDAGAFIASAQQGRRDAGRAYVNAYEPAVDVMLRWVRAIYREGEPAAVTLGTTPQGRPLAVALSHDVDYTDSMQLALAYARSEADQGVRATYFVQTKYVRDWNDQRFFDQRGVEQARQLHALGGELASHSVAHSPVFAQVPLGTGEERYPGYAPFVESKALTRDATVMGELRVSKFLLEQAVPEARVASFRPGHLQYPFDLPQALAATGYRYSSTLTAGLALSHLPFQLSHARAGRAGVPVYEFPITLEDEQVRPMDTVLLPRALETARKLARYGGLCAVLIHPNVLDDKLRFQQAFVARMQAEGAWIGPLGVFADWWTARDQVEVDAEAVGGRYRLRLRSPRAIAGLPLQLPPGWQLADAASVHARPSAHGMSVDLPAGDTVLALEPAPVAPQPHGVISR